MSNLTAGLKYSVGQWVEVTVKREGTPLVKIGKVIDASHDHATAECRDKDGAIRFTFSDDTNNYIVFRRMTSADWQARKRAKARR